jgi:hypothetical protein
MESYYAYLNKKLDNLQANQQQQNRTEQNSTQQLTTATILSKNKKFNRH